jgi:thioesterase domain-containing protein
MTELKEIVSDRGIASARMIELKPGRPGPCIFLVPGLGGRVEGFSELATLLITEMPLFGIEARGVSSDSDPDQDMHAMVQHYIDQIKTVQKNGPYFLIGHSFGGAVVFEMAQRLVAMRDHVGCLILLDTPLPKRYWSFRFFLVNLGPRLRGHFERITRDSLIQSLNYYTRRLRRRWQGLHTIPPDLMFGAEAARMLMAMDMMVSQWRPEFYPGRLTFFCCEGTELWTLYQKLAAELDTHVLAGDHINMVNQPYVQTLAREVSACLAKNM